LIALGGLRLGEIWNLYRRYVKSDVKFGGQIDICSGKRENRGTHFWIPKHEYYTSAEESKFLPYRKHDPSQAKGPTNNV
jgi:hypothetical protein